MAEMVLQLLKGDKVSSNVEYRSALPVNVSGIPEPVLASNGWMQQEPGLTQYATGQGKDRGGIWNERLNHHYRVSGQKLIEVSAKGIVTVLGNIPGSDNVSLPYSFQTQGIVASGMFFLWDGYQLSQVGAGASVNSGIAIGTPLDAVWVDGYYFLTDGEYLYHTVLGDESAINPLAFATAEFSPDPTIGLGLTSDNKVISFNRYSIEYFVNQATENFAFTRLPSRTVKYGLVGTHAKCEIGGTFFFLGGPKEGSVSVYQLGTGDVAEIASREACKVINQYSDSQLSLSTMEARVIDGYQYIILHLPEDCLMFNVNVARAVSKDYAWSFLQTGTQGAPWRAIHGVFEPRKGVWVYGDTWGPKIGILDYGLATQYGDLVECILYTPFTYLETASIDQLEIFNIPGFTPYVAPLPPFVPPPPPPVVGNLYAFGSGSSGQLGNNSTLSQSSPVMVGSALYLGGGAGLGISAGIREGGTLWTWGNNTYGALAVGDTTTRSSPTQVGARTDWATVSFGHGFENIMGVTSGGEIYTAGYAGRGMLGNGVTSSDKYSSPVQVAGTWLAGSMGSDNCYAIASDGSLWGWGSADRGSLCEMTAGTYNSPVQIATGNEWKWVSCGRLSGVAGKTTGETYVWGYNGTGQLGLGDTTDRSTPVQLDGDWVKVVSSNNDLAFHGNMYGIRSDGTLWGWGYNGKGQLGQGDTTNRSSPVQISDFADWVSISANGESWIGVRENGQCWGCGDGDSGQLDNYSTTNYSSPVQVAFVDTALLPVKGYDHSLLLFTDPFA